jgi:hypothetical protein
LVREVRLEDEQEVGGVERAFQFAVIGGRTVHHAEVHTGLVGQGLHPSEGHVLHLDVNLWAGGAQNILRNLFSSGADGVYHSRTAHCR